MNNIILTVRDLGSNGRLGNQIWQISAALGIADKLGCPVIFPKWEYSRYFNGPFDLGLNPEKITHLYEEPTFHYSEFNELECIEFNYGDSKIINLHGYFQSEKYFEHCREKIISQLSFTNETIQNSLKKLSQYISAEDMQHKLFVSVHFRFGDYVDNPYYANLCKIGYYDTAIDYIQTVLGNSKVIFLIFSDDPDIAEQRMTEIRTITPANYVVINNSDEMTDMCLMSVCNANIIANSSFSLWPSILNKELNKICVAPKKWFSGNGLINDTKDLYPKNAVLL